MEKSSLENLAQAEINWNHNWNDLDQARNIRAIRKYVSVSFWFGVSCLALVVILLISA